MEPPRRPVTEPVAGAAPQPRTLAPGQRWRGPIPPLTLGRGLVLLVLFGLIVFSYETCQKGGVKVSQSEAVETARPYAGFTPTRTQVRFIRQGINSRAYWAVSFSVPDPKKGDEYLRLTTVRVDATTGKIAAVNRTKGRQPSGRP
jgi:hypothetical protein